MRTLPGLIGVVGLAFLVGGCPNSNGAEAGGGGDGGAGIGGAGGSGGKAGPATGGTGGVAADPWSFYRIECDAGEPGGPCPESTICRNEPCATWTSGCNTCECDEPGCVCNDFCECETAELGGVCVPDDYAQSCFAHGDASACSADEHCRWVVPGCGDASGVAAGCTPKVDCGKDWCECVFVTDEACEGAYICVPP